ncbi:uncharacterized protein [Dermacentor albipictus]|uniref:uncharacterized protein isoform X4 n=1 Tax=Dermacentor albipictus TaxID=60249 RepID=UPI0038FC572D
MPGPVRAALAPRKCRVLRKTSRESLWPLVLAHGTRITYRLMARPPSPGIHTTQKPGALVSRFRPTAAAAVVWTTQWPVQASRQWNNHRTCLETTLGVLLEPMLGYSKNSPVHVPLFAAVGMLYTGAPTNTRATQTKFANRLI